METHNCLITTPHDAHDFWFTSSGGGHQLVDGWEPDHGTWDSVEANVKQWHCPGVDKPGPVG